MFAVCSYTAFCLKLVAGSDIRHRESAVPSLSSPVIGGGEGSIMVSAIGDSWGEVPPWAAGPCIGQALTSFTWVVPHFAKIGYVKLT